MYLSTKTARLGSFDFARTRSPARHVCQSIWFHLLDEGHDNAFGYPLAPGLPETGDGVFRLSTQTGITSAGQWLEVSMSPTIEECLEHARQCECMQSTRPMKRTANSSFGWRSTGRSWPRRKSGKFGPLRGRPRNAA